MEDEASEKREARQSSWKFNLESMLCVANRLQTRAKRKGKAESIFGFLVLRGFFRLAGEEAPKTSFAILSVWVGPPNRFLRLIWRLFCCFLTRPKHTGWGFSDVFVLSHVKIDLISYSDSSEQICISIFSRRSFITLPSSAFMECDDLRKSNLPFMIEELCNRLGG